MFFFLLSIFDNKYSIQGQFELIMLIIAPGQVRRHNRDIFSTFFNMKVFSVFSLELPHRGIYN